MKKEDFHIGLEFYTGSGKWRCTDIGTRVIVAIRIDQVTVCKYNRQNKTTTTEIVTDDQSWFNGPPYAVAESVFDEFDMGGCSLNREEFSEMQTEKEA